MGNAHSCAGTREMPVAVPEHGERCSSAGTREIPVAVPEYGKWRNEAESSREWYFERK